MAKKFKDVSSNSTRALQLWQILICKAHNRKVTTYGELAEMLDYGGATAINDMLGHITVYCHQEDLPSLTVLVNSKKTGVPSGGYIGDEADLDAKREKVFGHNWFAEYPPTPEQLAHAYKTGADAFRAQQSQSRQLDI